MEIRPAKKEELVAAYALYCAVQEEAAAPLTLEGLENEWKNPEGIFLAAFEESGLSGFIAGAAVAPREAEVRYLAVARERRGRGIGRALAVSFRARLGKGCRIFLEVAESNASGLAFYERIGASKVSLRKNYYKETAAWVLELKGG